MRWLGLLLLGACSFTKGVLPPGDAVGEDGPAADSTGPDDADVDGPLVDAQLDAARDAAPDARTCPNDYVVLTGGQSMSRYKRYDYASNSSNATAFSTASQTCVAGGGYVAIPNDAAELAALEAIAQNGNAPGYWVGITDQATEGTWVTVLGAAATYLPWKGAPNAQPNGGTAANCVVGSANELWDVDCALAYPFTCECSL